MLEESRHYPQDLFDPRGIMRRAMHFLLHDQKTRGTGTSVSDPDRLDPHSIWGGIPDPDV
jgi:hypothetical protein